MSDVTAVASGEDRNWAVHIAPSSVVVVKLILDFLVQYCCVNKMGIYVGNIAFGLSLSLSLSLRLNQENIFCLAVYSRGIF